MNYVLTSKISWAQQTNGAYARGNAIAVVGPSIYVAGTFTGPTAAFGNTVLQNATGYYDVFAAKLTDGGSAGSFAWAQQAGGAGWDEAFAIAASGPNVYVAGKFAGNTASFGSVVLTNRSTAYDAFLTKLIDGGTTSRFAWSQQAGGTGNDEINAVAVQGASVYVAGGFGGPTAQFGSSTVANVVGNAGPSQDIFVAKVQDLGNTSNFSWVQQAGSAEADGAYCLALNQSSIYVAGAVASPASFGNQVVSNSNVYQSAFLASLPDPTLTATTAAQGSLSFSLAPNPARTTATLTLPALPDAATAALTLTDALGRILRTEAGALSAANRHYELSLHGLTPGLYAVQVQAAGTRGTQRLVVE